jgi:hypothetical protein
MINEYKTFNGKPEGKIRLGRFTVGDGRITLQTWKSVPFGLH